MASVNTTGVVGKQSDWIDHFSIAKWPPKIYQVGLSMFAVKCGLLQLTRHMNSTTLSFLHFINQAHLCETEKTCATPERMLDISRSVR